MNYVTSKLYIFENFISQLPKLGKVTSTIIINYMHIKPFTLGKFKSSNK